MDRRTVELRVAGRSYRVVTTAASEELRRLAEVVDAKIAEVSPRGRPDAGHSVLLAAIALAHELESEQARRESIEGRARALLQRVLGRIDSALEPLAADVETVADE
jgi:cell division protein ZapA (FtsZ GTPase activity inhibitor)